jgi:hypothetical protein
MKELGMATKSAILLDRHWFDALCTKLGYLPDYVASIRVNKKDCWVTYTDGAGNLVTQAHEVRG